MLVGKTLNNRYQIIKELHAGEFSSTYLAEDQHLPNNPLLFVECLPVPSSQAEVLQVARDIFGRETSLLYELGTQNEQIPQLVARFEQEGEFYLIQEFTPGNSLGQELSLGMYLEEGEVVRFLQDILQLLQFLHDQNIIHGDIQPQNLWLRQEDNKIVLLGFAGVKAISTLAMGTPGYVPRQAREDKLTIAQDLYAVGITAIYALTGLTPEQLSGDNNPGKVVWSDQVKVSDSLGAILTKMVQSQERDRYQSAQEILQDLAIRGAKTSNSVRFAIKPQFDDVFIFADGLAPVEINGCWGYINQGGEVVIKPQFDEAYRFSEGLAPVKKGSHYGYIDNSGSFVIPPQFEDAYWFSDGMARVLQDRLWGYISQDGTLIIPAQFEDAYWFNEGLAPVKVRKKYGYINESGQFALEPQFESPGWFYEGLLAVADKKWFDRKWGYLDKSGNWAISPQFTEAYRFSEGLAPIKQDNLYGYIDAGGDFVIPPHFNDAYWFKEGIARVQQRDRWGYIDINGSFIIAPKFNQAYWFTEGLARVRQGNKWGFIDTNGNPIIEPQFDGITPFFEGMAAVRVGGQWGFLRNPLF